MSAKHLGRLCPLVVSVHFSSEGMGTRKATADPMVTPMGVAHRRSAESTAQRQWPALSAKQLERLCPLMVSVNFSSEGMGTRKEAADTMVTQIRVAHRRSAESTAQRHVAGNQEIFDYPVTGFDCPVTGPN